MGSLRKRDREHRKSQKHHKPQSEGRVNKEKRAPGGIGDQYSWTGQLTPGTAANSCCLLVSGQGMCPECLCEP